MSFTLGQEVVLLRRVRSYDKGIVGIFVSSKNGKAVVRVLSLTGKVRNQTFPFSALGPYTPAGLENSPWADMGYASDRGGPLHVSATILLD